MHSPSRGVVVTVMVTVTGSNARDDEVIEKCSPYRSKWGQKWLQSLRSLYGSLKFFEYLSCADVGVATRCYVLNSTQW